MRFKTFLIISYVITLFLTGCHQRKAEAIDSRVKHNNVVKETETTIIEVQHYDRDHYYKMIFQGEYQTIVEAAITNDLALDSDLFPLLLSVRLCENGDSGKEFGVIHPKAWDTDLRTQAGWASASVVKKWIRWTQSDSNDDFITYFSNEWAPKNADNDPDGLNYNFERNLRFWFNEMMNIHHNEHRNDWEMLDNRTSRCHMPEARLCFLD